MSNDANINTPKIAPDLVAEPSSPSDPLPSPFKPPQEINGPKGPEPTRFGDWERKGRCVDF